MKWYKIGIGFICIPIFFSVLSPLTVISSDNKHVEFKENYIKLSNTLQESHKNDSPYIPFSAKVLENVQIIFDICLLTDPSFITYRLNVFFNDLEKEIFLLVWDALLHLKTEKVFSWCVQWLEETKKQKAFEEWCYYLSPLVKNALKIEDAIYVEVDDDPQPIKIAAPVARLSDTFLQLAADFSPKATREGGEIINIPRSNVIPLPMISKAQLLLLLKYIDAHYEIEKKKYPFFEIVRKNKSLVNKLLSNRFQEEKISFEDIASLYKISHHLLVDSITHFIIFYLENYFKEISCNDKIVEHMKDPSFKKLLYILDSIHVPHFFKRLQGALFPHFTLLEEKFLTKSLASVAFSKDGKFLATAIGGIIKIWGMDKKQVGIIDGKVPIKTIYFDQENNDILFTTDASNILKKWKLSLIQSEDLQFPSNNYLPINNSSFFFLRPFYKGTLYKTFEGYYIEDIKKNRRLLEDSKGTFELPFISNDISTLIALFKAENRPIEIRVWDVNTGKIRSSFLLPTEKTKVSHCELSHDGEYVGLTFYDRGAEIWKEGKTVYSFGRITRADCITFSPDKKWVAVAFEGNNVRVYRTRFINIPSSVTLSSLFEKLEEYDIGDSQKINSMSIHRKESQKLSSLWYPFSILKNAAYRLASFLNFYQEEPEKEIMC